MKEVKTVILKTSEIIPDENQPRKLFEPTRLKSLKDSISTYGVMNPIRVEKVGDKFLIEDGERRFRAATELGLKEVPCIIVEPKNEVDRLVQQFHIQEQHEEWTPTEKAVTVDRLSKELGVNLAQICSLLGIERSKAQRYIAFNALIDKKTFQKNDIGLSWAQGIQTLKGICRNIYRNVLEEEFTREMEKKLELAVILRVKDGQFLRAHHLSRVKDSFTKDPKSIKEFLDTNVTAENLYIKTKAKGAYHLRNATTSSGYVATHIKKFLELKDVKVTEKNIAAFKSAAKAIKELLDKVEE